MFIIGCLNGCNYKKINTHHNNLVKRHNYGYTNEILAIETCSKLTKQLIEYKNRILFKL